MSEIVEVIRRGSRGGKPTLLVRCASCARVYVMTADKAQAIRVVRCNACRKPKPRRPAAPKMWGIERYDWLAVYGDDRGGPWREPPPRRKLSIAADAIQGGSR